MVFFKDKAMSPYSTAQPLQFLSQRAIDRRIKQGIAVTDQDIPVNENYVQGVSNTGANVFFRTRWMNGVLVQCDAGLVSILRDLPYVDHVEFVAPDKKLVSTGRIKGHQKRKVLRLRSTLKVNLK
jgi:hypothetical protein